jgi:hypothetical protein
MMIVGAFPLQLFISPDTLISKLQEIDIETGKTGFCPLLAY